MKRLFPILALIICCIIPVTAYNTSLYPVRGTWFNGDGGSFQTFTTDGEITTFCTNNGMVFPSAHSQHLAWYDATDTSAGTLDFGIAVMPHTYQADTSVKYGLWLINCKFPSNSTELQLYNGVFYRNETPLQNINADFNATPLSGETPLTVPLMDNSTGNYISAWNWTIYPSTGWIYASGSSTSKNPTITFTAAGNYTVMHGASGFSGSDIELKPDYIIVTQATGNKVVYLVVNDGKTGLYVNGYTANVYDTLNSKWTNGTPPDGILVINTNTSAILTANVSATGYVSKTETKTLRSDDWPEDWEMTLFKTADQPNSTNIGNTSLRIWVTSSDTGGLSLPGVSVQISDGQAMLTPDSGIAIFTVINGTSYSWEANKYPDYDGATGVITASGAVTNVNVMLKRSEGNLPTPTGTATIRPTATLTGAALEQHNREQDQAMMNQLRDNGPNIIGLCILVIIFSLIGMLTGGIKKM